MRTTVNVTDSLQALYAPIRDDLHEVEVVFDRAMVSDLPFINDLCDTVRSYRGKMLRPALLLLTARAVGNLHPIHHQLAAVIEMVHMATLVHDDVLDEAEERRRQPTIGHIHGNTAAVLLGDYLFSHAFHLCAAQHSHHATKKIGGATNVVCAGELLQNQLCGRSDLSEAQYFQIIQRKTATLTAVAAELGAYYAEADQPSVEAMRCVGEKIGIAFQIIDDVLDVIGDRATVGKTLGRDARLGKCTLPTIHCLANADEVQASQVRRALADRGAEESVALRECLSATGSIEYAVGIARQYVAEAVALLENLPVSDARSSLLAVAEFLTARRF